MRDERYVISDVSLQRRGRYCHLSYGDGTASPYAITSVVHLRYCLVKTSRSCETNTACCTVRNLYKTAGLGIGSLSGGCWCEDKLIDVDVALEGD